jgi:hypothetical protein
MWCLTGQELGPDSLIWGEHLVIPFEAAGGFAKAQHHAIGVDHGMVVHFKTQPSGQGIGTHKKTLLWNKHVDIGLFDEFNAGGLARKVSYESKYNTAQARRDARNRAINCFVCSERLNYSLLTNNCEHLAEFCKKGVGPVGKPRVYLLLLLERQFPAS